MHVCLKTVSINVANTEQYQLICKPGSFTELLLMYVAFSALFLKFKSKPSIDYEVFVQFNGGVCLQWSNTTNTHCLDLERG